MKLLDRLSNETISSQVKHTIDLKVPFTIDESNNYNDLADNRIRHKAMVTKDKKETNEILPSINTAISNTKRLPLIVNCSIGEKYLQRYLDRKGYKFNRKYFNSVFVRLVTNSVFYTIVVIHN